VSVRSFLKNLLIFNVLFGVHKLKVSGINDKGNIFTDLTLSFDATLNTITCPNVSVIPTWLMEGKYFRCNLTGYTPNLPPLPLSPPELPDLITNHYKLFVVKKAEIVGGILIITVDPTASGVSTMSTYGPDSGMVDGRICTVTNNSTINRQDTNGSSIYNLHNFSGTGLPDGSCVSVAVASHYHTPQSLIAVIDWDVLITHTHGISGHLSYGYDNVLGIHIPLGPLVVVDNNGNVVASGS
jgi:hypothetical protein